MIIDLHNHLIPGVDDGAQNIADSIALAEQAVSEGVEYLVITPHHRNGQYVNHASGVIEAVDRLQEDLDNHAIPLNVYPSQEIRLTEQLIDDLLNQDLLSLDDGGRYYLIEFPTASIPDYSEQSLKQLIQRGITPVIAHPERNHVFAKDFQQYAHLIEMGCIGQITTSSMAGVFGQKIQETSVRMIEYGLAHILASDAHSVGWRPFNIQIGFDALETYFGRDKVIEFQENARSIFNGEAVVRQDKRVEKLLLSQRIETKKKKKWFKLF